MLMCLVANLKVIDLTDEEVAELQKMCVQFLMILSNIIIKLC